MSDAWLAGKREKSFSVGSFSETYMASHPIATLRSPTGELLAFVTSAGVRGGDIAGPAGAAPGAATGAAVRSTNA